MTRSVGPRTTTIVSRDGLGNPLVIDTTTNGHTVLIETQRWSGDNLLASHEVIRANFLDARSYRYAQGSRRLMEERLDLSSTVPWTNNFTYDAGVSAGLGVLTAVDAPANLGAVWTGTVDGLSRVNQETHDIVRRSARGTVNGPSTIGASLDGHPMPLTMVGTQSNWQASMELAPGSHQLIVSALHPSGQYTAWATNNFNLHASALDTVLLTYDGAGQITQRLWKDSSNQTVRTQNLTWDGRGRLLRVVERDSGQNGFNWFALCDGQGRRIRTTTVTVTNGVALADNVLRIDQIFDPEVEFLELGVTIGGLTTWKLHGPDLNGTYGGLNGLGGFDAVVPGPELFCPTISDTRGNLQGVFDYVHGGIAWFGSRPSGYGATPGSRPVPLGQGAAVDEASAWRSRWADPTGLYWLGARYYDPSTLLIRCKAGAFRLLSWKTPFGMGRLQQEMLLAGQFILTL